MTPPAEGAVIVAASAGADSTALALLLADAGIGPLHLVRVDHGWRPAARAAEEAQVAALAQRIGASFEAIALAPPPARRFDEAWARAARYAALLDVARRRDAPLIATGHHAADRRETQLLLLARGSDLAALRGMAAVRPFAERLLWRPLLDREPAALRALLRERGVAWLDDPSNRDFRFARNRMRHHVLPLLARNGDPLLARLDALHERTSRLLVRLASRADVALHHATPGAASGLLLLDFTTLQRWPTALLAPLLDAMARRLHASRPPRHRRSELREFSAWLREGAARGTFHLDHLDWFRAGARIGVAQRGALPPPVEPTALTLGHNERAGYSFAIEVTAADDVAGDDRDLFVARFTDRARLSWRTLRAGDRLKQVAADRPWFERPFWPAIEEDGALAWIPGLGAPPRLTPGTRTAVSLRVVGLPASE